MGSACCGSKKPPSLPQPVPAAFPSRRPSPSPPPFLSPTLLYSPSPIRESTPVRREHSAAQRCKTIAVSTTNPLLLMDGYLNEPLLPLEEALKPVNDSIDQLSAYIKEAIFKCHFPSEHNLTRDESAAIYIYTMRWESKCLYNQLHAALNSKDQSKISPWFKYLKLLKTALNKLPDANIESWQGTSYDIELKDQLCSNSSLLYSSLGSCLPTNIEIKDYLQQNVGTKMILTSYEFINGKWVTGYTASNSPEVIMWPGVKLSLAKCIVADANGSLIMHLVQKLGKHNRIRGCYGDRFGKKGSLMI